MSPVAGSIFDIKRFAIHDGPGIRTTVFFMGCPLDCPWCHNPECHGFNENGEVKAGDREVTVAAVMDEIIKDRLFYDESGGGVTFSGGEPMAQIDFLTALLAACRQAGVRAVVDTSGYAPAADFERLAGLVEMFLFDLKIMDPDRHRQETGVPIDPILDNLGRLAAAGSRLIVRVPMISGLTDSVDNIDKIGHYLLPFRDVRQVSLLPYNKLGQDKARRFHLKDRNGGWAAPDERVLAERKAALEALGFRVKIGG